jgi:hypothetical protein
MAATVHPTQRYNLGVSADGWIITDEEAGPDFAHKVVDRGPRDTLEDAAAEVARLNAQGPAKPERPSTKAKPAARRPRSRSTK